MKRWRNLYGNFRVQSLVKEDIVFKELNREDSLCSISSYWPSILLFDVSGGIE